MMITRVSQWPRWTTGTVVGLLVAGAGILLQYAGDPDLFGDSFPPGIYFLVVAGVVTVLARSWPWAPIAALAVALLVTVGGVVGGQLAANISSGHATVAAGALVMQAGLVATIVAGIGAIRTGRRRRAPAASPAPSPTVRADSRR